MDSKASSPPFDSLFQSTRWTQVRQSNPASEDGQRALSELCSAYYEPVLAFLRCRLHDPEETRDLAHAFFSELLERGGLHRASPEHGKFRAYLLGALKHFLGRHFQSAHRLKRGASADHLPLDNREATLTPDSELPSPDLAFDRQWALTVLARALDTLQTQCRMEGSEALFEKAKPLLEGDLSHGVQAALAAEIGMKPDAFRMAIHRLRKRLRNGVKAEIQSTLDRDADVQEELESLFAALSR